MLEVVRRKIEDAIVVDIFEYTPVPFVHIPKSHL